MSDLCNQTTAAGTPCRNRAVEASDRCVAHLRLNGRKSTLTPEVAGLIVQMIQAGNHTNVACIAAGVPVSTFEKWWKRGDPRNDDEKDAGYREFRQRVERARAEGEVVLVTRVAAAATRDVQTAIWLLERMYPERWARVSQRDAAAEREQAERNDLDDPLKEIDELADARRRRISG